MSKYTVCAKKRLSERGCDACLEVYLAICILNLALTQKKIDISDSRAVVRHLEHQYFRVLLSGVVAYQLTMYMLCAKRGLAQSMDCAAQSMDPRTIHGLHSAKGAKYGFVQTLD